MTKIINNTDGWINCIKVEDPSYLQRPENGERMMFSYEDDNAIFSIRDKYLLSITSCHKIKLPDLMELKSGDTLKITLKLQRFIRGNKINYEIPLNTTIANGKASIKIKGNENCTGNDEILSSETSCGSINFSFEHEISDDLGYVCDFDYAICFDPIKLTLLDRNIFDIYNKHNNTYKICVTITTVL